MKVEKINNNKAMIILTLAELAKRKITLKDIKEGAENVQDFFFEILEDANITEEFAADSSQLFVEVTTSEDDIFMITITKADCLPDIAKYDKPSKRSRVTYTVSSNIYSFSSLKELYEFCKQVTISELFVGVNSLYEFNGKYFLMFSNSTIKKTGFVKTFSVLSEYVDKYFSKQTTAFLEYAKLIIAKNAVQTLQKI